MKASDGGPVELINGRNGKRKGEEERGERGDQKTGSPSGCERETVVVLHCLCFCLLKYCLVAVFHLLYCMVLMHS